LVVHFPVWKPSNKPSNPITSINLLCRKSLNGSLRHCSSVPVGKFICQRERLFATMDGSATVTYRSSATMGRGGAAHQCADLHRSPPLGSRPGGCGHERDERGNDEEHVVCFSRGRRSRGRIKSGGRRHIYKPLSP